MLGKDFIEFLYEAAHIQRWNDHIRPGGFTELDKQAHKMMILYILARYEEEDHGAVLDWRALIEGGQMSGSFLRQMRLILLQSLHFKHSQITKYMLIISKLTNINLSILRSLRQTYS